MNIFLVPYTWSRHYVVGWFCTGVAVLTWCALLWAMVWKGPAWAPEWDGALYLGSLAAAVAGASVLAESTLRRRPFYKLVPLTLLATAISGALAVGAWWLWLGVLAPAFLAPLVAFAIESLGIFTRSVVAEGQEPNIRALVDAVPGDVTDPSLVSLRYRLGIFMIAGVATAIGPILVRRFRGAVNHLVAGLLAGLLAAAAWHISNFVMGMNLYLAGVAAAATWGMVFGVFAWSVPDELYAGWLRVLSRNRFARRIPIDAPDQKPKERFVGHFPRGMDLFLPLSPQLPPESEVQELHLSIAVDAKQNYFARGLTLAPTAVHRFLERVDLRYDPRLPAPLETPITSGDRITLGTSAEPSVVEFIMLPKEEQ